MPTTNLNVTGGGCDNDIHQILPFRFQTTDATPHVYTFAVVDPLPGAINQAYSVQVRWTAVGPSSISGGESISAWYDNTTLTLPIFSTALAAAGSATLTIGQSGRTSTFTFTGLAATNLQWHVFFTVVQLAAE